MKKLLLILSLHKSRAASGNCAPAEPSPDVYLKLSTVIKIAILIILLFLINVASAQRINTSVLPDGNYRFYKGKLTIGGGADITHANSIFTSTLNSNKGLKSGLVGGVMALTTIPFFISAGRNKKNAFLTLTDEKVVLGAPGHNRFSYPAIAFRVKF
jgi:hypothetical protein